MFPGVETPILNYGDLQTAIESQIVADGLQKVPVIITKIIQLFETKNSRHSVMIVGDTGDDTEIEKLELYKCKAHFLRDTLCYILWQFVAVETFLERAKSE